MRRFPTLFFRLCLPLALALPASVAAQVQEPPVKDEGQALCPL